MIWFILIYIITIILLCITFYRDMDKGESLDHYFKNIKFLDFIIIFLLPGLNTIISVLAIFYILFKKIWDKIKYWEK